MVAKYWFEKLAGLPVEVEIAWEFRYREPPLPEGGVCIAVSQSGETIDTLAAMRYAKAQKQPILSVVNVPESAIARESHVVLPTLAGPGDRRRLDQGLHNAARRAAGARSPPAVRAARCRRRTRRGSPR